VSRSVSRSVVTVLTLLVFVTIPAAAKGQNVTAMWDASAPLDLVTGYQVCISTSSLSCDIGLASLGASETSYTFSPNGGTRTYVAVRALNPQGPSPFSNEVTFSIPHFTQPPDLHSVAGVATTLQLDIYDPDGGPLTLTHHGLPVGLTLNPSTGEITGTPYVLGRYDVSVFAADDLVTVARSWVWTITDETSESTAPTLTISSHTPGQTVATSTVTISGTASDSGRGDSGIGVVRVNDVTASGGFAMAGNTAHWSRTLALQSGANTITVEAADGAGNMTMQQFTLWEITPPTWRAGESASASVP
jgi:hypothetical protein